MVVLLLIFTLLTMPAFAQTETSPESSLRLGLTQSQFAGEPQARQVENDQNWSLGVAVKKQEPGWSTKADIMGFGSFQSSLDQYFGIPEAYFKIKNKSNVVKEQDWSMTIGRERRLWSRMDDQLALGVWQPTLRWDAMRPVSQGLTGLFVDYPISKNWTLGLFTSPLFLPDQGPNFELKNGQFSSRNRWFVHPQSQYEMMGGSPSPITYELEKPSVNDVVFQSSFAGSLRFERKKFWAQASAAYMPANQMHLGLANYKNVSNLKSIVRVIPKTYKHNVAAFETGMRGETQEFWLSTMTDSPQRPEFSQKNEVGIGWEESEFSQKTYVGLGFVQKLPAMWGVSQDLQVSFLRGWKRVLSRQSESSLMDAPVNSSFDRPFYEKLMALDWMLAWKKYKRQHWEAKLRYWQTIDPRSSWVSPMFSWVDGQWTWILSGDLLGAQGNDDEALKSYFGQYRNNSRLLLGLSYVF